MTSKKGHTLKSIMLLLKRTLLWVATKQEPTPQRAKVAFHLSPRHVFLWILPILSNRLRVKGFLTYAIYIFKIQTAKVQSVAITSQLSVLNKISPTQTNVTNRSYLSKALRARRRYLSNRMDI